MICFKKNSQKLCTMHLYQWIHAKSEYLETATKSYEWQSNTYIENGLICIPACVQIVNCDIIAGDWHTCFSPRIWTGWTQEGKLHIYHCITYQDF